MGRPSAAARAVDSDATHGRHDRLPHAPAVSRPARRRRPADRAADGVDALGPRRYLHVHPSRRRPRGRTRFDGRAIRDSRSRPRPRLAGKATTSISSELGDAIEIGEDFEVAELLVQRGSPAEGRTIAESGIGDVTGVNVIGAWFTGEFVSPPAPHAVIDEHTILLVVGREKQLEELRALTLSSARRFRRGTVIVAGYGEVGSTAAEKLASAGVPHLVVDKQDKPGVDLVGDITDPQTLSEANVSEARGVLLALDNDTTAVFATLVSERVSEETEVIARANETESIAKLYRAGADYVLALSTVAGRMLASTVLDEEVIAPQSQIEIVRTNAPGLVGRTLAGADVRARTNCTVIAVERNGALVTEVGPEFRVEADDDLVVAGVDEDIYRFNEQFG